MTLSERQRLAHRRWTARGGQSIAYFVALAAAQGIAITITEHPLDAWGAAGTAFGGARFAVTPAQFVWTVNLPFQRQVLSRWGGVVWGGAAFGAVVPNGLECPFGREAPAHTQILFNYI